MKSKSYQMLIIAAALAIAVTARIIGLPFVSWDLKLFVMPWYAELATQGFRALAQPFSNYSPPYLYLLWLVTLTRGFLPEVFAIKFISTLFDLGSAFMIYRILRLKYSQGATPLMGAAVFLALPTIFLNSGAWGQADATYAFFLLISLYYFLQERPLPAMLAFGTAFAFKAQVIFFAPVLLLLTFKRRLPIWYYFLVPLVYIFWMIPSLLAGRPFMDLITVYLAQADYYHQLSMKAPNFYLLIPGDFYTPAVLIGSGLTVVLFLLWAWTIARKSNALTQNALVLCAAVAAICAPFLLPKMHERYFYLADVLTLLLAFHLPRLWFAPLGTQIVSTLTYSVFLSMGADSVPSFGALFIFLALCINTALIISLLCSQYKFIDQTATNA